MTPPTLYTDLLPILRAAKGANAEARDSGEVSPWKVRERDIFLEFLVDHQVQTLLELGSGPGRDGLFFQERGLSVTCTDLSPEMVARCRSKGLNAHVMDFLNLELGRTFGAIYALNSLLHVPKADLPAVLKRVEAHLEPGGLFYFGVYGGHDFEGVWEDDLHEPKRFFAYYRDHDLLTRLSNMFDLLIFAASPPTENEIAPFTFSRWSVSARWSQSVTTPKLARTRHPTRAAWPAGRFHRRACLSSA